jgi:hypothetical protein
MAAGDFLLPGQLNPRPDWGHARSHRAAPGQGREDPGRHPRCRGAPLRAAGTGGDVLGAGQTTVVGPAKVLLGDGSNDVVVAGHFRAALVNKTGDGNDAIDLTGTTVGGKQTIDPGVG